MGHVDQEHPVGPTDETAEVEWVATEEVLTRLVHDEEKRMAAFFLEDARPD